MSLRFNAFGLAAFLLCIGGATADMILQYSGLCKQLIHHTCPVVITIHNMQTAPVKTENAMYVPDPENGASLQTNGMMYFSSVYRASVVKYDPKRRTYREITIPSVTGRPNTHVSGIEADRSGPTIWAIVDPAVAFETYGQNLTGPAGLVAINRKDRVVHQIDLTLSLEKIEYMNGGYPVGGPSDATTDYAGNVYVVLCFGQAIIKLDRKTMTQSIFFLRMNPTPRKMTYSGIELADGNTLIVWNDELSQIETFDINSRNPQPRVPAGGKLNKPIAGDAIFIPSFSHGSCLLVNNDKANTVEVFKTCDGWKSAEHTASIDASKFGGTPTFTFELGSKIYYGVSYFADGPSGSRNAFPQGDITDEVTRACARN